MITATAMAAAELPQAWPRPVSTSPMMTAMEPSTSEGKMQRVGRQRLASGLARRAMHTTRARNSRRCRSPAPRRRSPRVSAAAHPLAQPAPGFHQNAAGQHVEQRDDEQRRQALELAVAVMMFLVGRLIGHPDHQPGDDGVAITSTEECRASEISASEPIAMPTANFAAAMPALAKIEIAATLVLMEEGNVMGGGLAGGCPILKAAVAGAIAIH